MNISLSPAEQRFVITSGNSVSCLGFHVVFAQAREMARRLRAVSQQTRYAKGMDALLSLVAPRKEDIGTLEQYHQYQKLLVGYSKLEDKATWFDGRTPKAVQQVLERVRKSDARVRIFHGDVKTGRDWMDEFDTIGRIGRSTGPMKSPLMIAEGENGGPALLTDCIVRVINLDTREELYRHKKYHLPLMTLHDADDFDGVDGFTHIVKVQTKAGDMETFSKFKDIGKAYQWMAFMNGYIHSLDDC